MDLFLYKVKDDTGRTLVGLTEAQSAGQVKKLLQSSSELYFFSTQAYDSKELAKLRLKLDDLLLFTHRLYHLIDAGLPILQALYILWKQSDQKEVQMISSYIRKKLEDGSTLHESFAFFPKVFPQMYLALIGVAEMGPGLVQVLQRLSQHIESQKQFIARMKKATLYPLFVLGFAFLVLMGMFIFVVPIFQKVILKLHAKLPALTVVLFGFSNLIRNVYFLIFLLLLGVGAFFAWRFFSKMKSFQYMLDYWKFKLPMIKTVLYPLYVGRFSRCLSLLIASGVPLVNGLDVAKATVVNRRIENAVDDIKKQITEGGTLYDAFKSTRAFPIVLIEMIGIGESSGKLQEMLEHVSTSLEEEVDYAIARFLTLLEPLLIVFVGGIVLTVMLGIYLPIFSVQSALRGM